MSAVEKAKLLSLQQKKMIEGCRKIFLDDMPAFLIKGNGIAIRAGGFLVRYTLDSRKKKSSAKKGAEGEPVARENSRTQTLEALFGTRVFLVFLQFYPLQIQKH